MKHGAPNTRVAALEITQFAVENKKTEPEGSA